MYLDEKIIPNTYVFPTCMELVVAKVERSVDGFERLKVNVNLMSFDRLNIRLLTRSWQQPSIFHCSSPFSKTKWQVQTKWQVLTSRASISSNSQCKKAPQLSMFFYLFWYFEYSDRPSFPSPRQWRWCHSRWPAHLEAPNKVKIKHTGGYN